MQLEKFKEEARKKFQSLDLMPLRYNNPIDFLYSLDWDISNELAFSEVKVACMNVDFNQGGCFGKSLRAAVLAEQFFPNEELFLGEVYEDFLRRLLVKGASKENWKDVSYLDEILMYENPHTIIVHGDRQFDPLFQALLFPRDLMSHPSVGKLPLWSGLYCSYLVSEAFIARTRSIKETFKILLTASAICPEMVLIKENLISVYGLFQQFNEGIKLAKQVSFKRKDARTLFVLWTLTEDDSYKNQIINEYDISMFKHLNSLNSRS